MEFNKIRERRKKRMFIPFFYFLVELIFYWLVLSLIQVEFDIRLWAVWSLLVFAIAVVYSLAKTVHIYKRQKDYPKA